MNKHPEYVCVNYYKIHYLGQRLGRKIHIIYEIVCVHFKLHLYKDNINITPAY